MERRDRVRESSMKHSSAENDNRAEGPILRTRQVWEPRLGYRITDSAAGQFANNVTGFFAVLAQWALMERLEAANDLSMSTRGANGEACDDR